MKISFDSMFCFKYPGDSRFDDFRCNVCELIYFISGNGKTIINGKEYPYYAGCVCFTTPADIRTNICRDETEYICVRFAGEEINEIASGIYFCDNKDVFSDFLNIKHESSNKYINYKTIINLKINEILVKLIRCTKDDNSSIYDIIHKIDSNNILSASVEELASETSYSYHHFRHKFKEITGVSPIEYIMSRRIFVACNLLMQSDLSCAEIAQMCEFSNSAQFSKIFKEKIGINPNQYRTERKSK